MRDVLIAIDCSLRWTNAAIMSGGEIIVSHNADIGRRQAAELPSIAAALIAESGVAKNSISHVAVTVGPGYFTGVRIGMAFAAALAFGLNARVIPVGTLDALMFGKQIDNSICLVYSGKGRVYAKGHGQVQKINTGDYSVSEILNLVEGIKDISYFSDDPEKIAGLDDKIERILPCAENVVKIAWAMKHSSVSPWEVRANWCKSPV